MKQQAKRILSLVLTFAMALSLSVTAWADNDVFAAKGKDSGVNTSLRLIIMPISLEMKKGDSTKIEVKCPDDDTGVTYEWESEHGIVSVASLYKGSGSSDKDRRRARVKALDVGYDEITVYARLDGEIVGSDTIPVTVEVDSTPVEIVFSGKSSFSMEVGAEKNLKFSVSGGSGSYVYEWDSSLNVAITDSMRGNATVRGASAGEGYVSCIVSDAEDRTNFASINWQVTVTSSAKPVKAKLSSTNLALRVDDTVRLSVSASGGSGDFTYTWRNNNLRHVNLIANGDSAAVTGVTPGTDTIKVDVYDNVTKESVTLACVATVESSSVSYNVSDATSAGKHLALDRLTSEIAREYRRQFGTNLSYGASVRTDSPSSKYGMIRMQDGTPVYSALNMTFATLMDCYFDAFVAGTFSTDYTVSDGGNVIRGTISIKVSGGSAVKSATLSSTSLSMDTFSSRYLDIEILPAAADYTVYWSVDDSRIATVYGRGASATVSSLGRVGTTTVYAVVTDGTGAKITRSCTVTVRSAATYNPTLTWTMGSDYYGTDVSDSMAKQFRNVYGYNLDSSATISFPTTGNTRYGVIRQPNGTAIRANVNYTFHEWIEMHFEPLATGTFSLPYSLNYKGNALEGTIDITIRSSSVSATLSKTNIVLAPYSNQAIYVSVTPASSYYTVRWASGNEDIVTVSDTGSNATVRSGGKTGTTTIVAAVADRNGVETYHSCAVTVTERAANAYSPSVSMTVGAPYIGTGTSDAMKAQFRSLYGVELPDSANIIFASTGDNNIATMRLRDGTPIRANINYTMADYVAMYTEAIAAGTFSVPYTLSYDGNSLSGNVLVLVNAASIVSSISLNSANAYTFSTASADGSAGSSILGASITNATGAKWSYLRFGASTTVGVGTLYQDAQRTPLDNRRVSQSELGGICFVPNGSDGEYSIPYAVYTAADVCIANGVLRIRVTMPAVTVSFEDVKDNDYFNLPVKWAVGRQITTGTSATKFSPNQNCTKAQIITFLWRAAGAPEPANLYHFTDVNVEEYYAKAAAWAAENGMVSGTLFAPSAPCTREMAVEFMWKHAGSPTAAKAGFTDVSSPAVDWAFEKGVTTGTSATTFGPGGICTRGQIVTFLYRAFGR